MLPYGHQIIEEDDIQAVVAALRSDFLTTGPEVERFEQAFAQCVQARHAVAVSSCTAALHAMVAALDLGPQDEVVVPAITFAASANCVRYCGAKVIFGDVRRDTLTLDPDSVTRVLTPRTRAILAVDYAGQPADYQELSALAQTHGLALLADAAHSLGGDYRGRPVGALARMTAFSFHPVKHITTGEGGMVTTDDADLARRLRLFRTHGITTDFRQRESMGDWFYEMESLGYNYRLGDLQCALGRSQLAKLPVWLGRRRRLAALYRECLADLDCLELPCEKPDRQSAWHLYVVRLHLAKLKRTRLEIFRALRVAGIGVNVHYIPVPWHPYYQRLGYHRGQWPVAEAEYERLLTLPLWAGVSDSDVEHVGQELRHILRNE